jgi:hypothetical protein
MEYIKINNNIVVELISCVGEPPTNDMIPVKLEGGIHVGDDIRMFDSEWNRHPLDELVNDGYVKLDTVEKDDIYPIGTVLEKVENNKIVRKTKYDFVTEGVIELDIEALEYPCHESKEIKKAKSIDELCELGVIDNTQRLDMIAANTGIRSSNTRLNTYNPQDPYLYIYWGEQEHEPMDEETEPYWTYECLRAPLHGNYGDLVLQLIRHRYKLDDELAAINGGGERYVEFLTWRDQAKELARGWYNKETI